LKNPYINLYMDRKKTLLLAASFSLLLTMTIIAAVYSTRPLLGQLNSLIRSDYVYSATTRNPVGEDDYIQYNAGISFALAKDSATGINADIVMQLKRSQYTENICWNADPLGPRELAISKELARAYGLRVGDSLFSRHLVDGENCEYIVRQLLPELLCVRFVDRTAYKDGVIVMGYDSRYEENISHTIIMFSKTPIDELAQSISEMPDSLLYRDDEISSVLKRATPYLLIFFILSILLTAGLVFFCAKSVAYNFKRLVRLGAEEKELNRAYNRAIYGVGFSTIFVALVISAFILCIIGIPVMSTIYMGVMVLGDLLTLAFTLNERRKRLWRRA